MFTNLNRQPSALFILLLNLVPIWGVLHWGWTPFYVFYLFWLETLIVSIFNTFKIVACRGDENNSGLLFNGQVHKPQRVDHLGHISKASGYLLVRIFIFFFYLLFIVVFIGMFASRQTGSKPMAIMEVLLFRHEAFNYTLLAFVFNQLMQFIFDFYANGNYKRTYPSDFAAIFDGRQLVIHVAVVLAGVIGAQGEIFKTKINPDYISVIMVSIFCVVKSIYEVFKFTQNKKMIDKRYTIPDEAIQVTAK